MQEIRIYTPPIVGSLLTLAGGFFVLLGGLFLAVLNVTLLWAGLTQRGTFLYAGVLIGFLLIAVSVAMWVIPRGRIAWGTFAIVLAGFSIFFAVAGFGLGFVLALAGGILSIRHRPTIVSVTAVPA
ncbi:MAG: DUF6114 domain-containing protein [Thermoplasmata archaeon]